MPSVGLPGVRGAVPRAVPGLLRLFAPRESMEDNPFDEAIVDEDLFALDDETLLNSQGGSRQQMILQGEETANSFSSK